MSVQVFSEIGPLERVVVHAPGPEVDAMLPELMHRLLFDDIVHGVRARTEHRQFRAILRAFGVDVVDSGQLLREALEAAPEAAAALLDDVQQVDGLPHDVMAHLGSLAPSALADALVHGRAKPGKRDDLYRDAPTPLPNLLFSRDAGAVLGDQVVVSCMKTAARQREPMLLRFVLHHHPSFDGTSILQDFVTRHPRDQLPSLVAPSIEGGDVLVLQEGVVLIGISERTMEAAADRLVEALRADDRFRAAVLVYLPAARAVMHLDTLFTRASEGECLVYAPMIVEGGVETVSAVRIDLTRKEHHGTRHPSLLGALRSLGIDLEPLYCGGRASYVQQAREQWTDGANCFAVRPGVITLYERNRATADELQDHGYELVEVGGLPFDEEGRCLRSFRSDRKVALLLEGHELSRARGGPRCMTMPLRRALT